jgi:hypothetical protein
MQYTHISHTKHTHTKHTHTKHTQLLLINATDYLEDFLTHLRQQNGLHQNKLVHAIHTHLTHTQTNTHKQLLLMWLPTTQISYQHTTARESVSIKANLYVQYTHISLTHTHTYTQLLLISAADHLEGFLTQLRPQIRRDKNKLVKLTDEEEQEPSNRDRLIQSKLDDIFNSIQTSLTAHNAATAAGNLKKPYGRWPAQFAQSPELAMSCVLYDMACVLLTSRLSQHVQEIAPPGLRDPLLAHRGSSGTPGPGMGSRTPGPGTGEATRETDGVGTDTDAGGEEQLEGRERESAAGADSESDSERVLGFAEVDRILHQYSRGAMSRGGDGQEAHVQGESAQEDVGVDDSGAAGAHGADDDLVVSGMRGMSIHADVGGGSGDEEESEGEERGESDDLAADMERLRLRGEDVAQGDSDRNDVTNADKLRLESGLREEDVAGGGNSDSADVDESRLKSGVLSVRDFLSAFPGVDASKWLSSFGNMTKPRILGKKMFECVVKNDEERVRVYVAMGAPTSYVDGVIICVCVYIYMCVCVCVGVYVAMGAPTCYVDGVIISLCVCVCIYIYVYIYTYSCVRGDRRADVLCRWGNYLRARARVCVERE